MKPLISIIIPTYNRATTLTRTIDSLLNQTYDNLEIIIVEDGSTDNTLEIIGKITDPRIRLIRHEVNKGVSAAKNTGLNHIKGSWFSILDSDDEILRETLEVLMRIPLEVDPSINSITCNCQDTSTGKFSGMGLEGDQYLNMDKLNRSQGEFWGLTKTELLGNNRFNERLIGFESTLWHTINKKVKGYYIHKALRIYHTEGDDRISNASRKGSLRKTSIHYQALSEETTYLEEYKKNRPGRFSKECLIAVVHLVADHQKEYARFYYKELKNIPGQFLYKTIAFGGLHSNSLLMKLSLKLFEFVKSIR